MFEKLKQLSTTKKILFFSTLFLVIFAIIAICISTFCSLLLTYLSINHLSLGQNVVYCMSSVLIWFIALFLNMGVWLYYAEKMLKNQKYIYDSKHSVLGKSEWLIDMSQKQIPQKQHIAFNKVYPQTNLPGFVICVETYSNGDLFFHQAIKNKSINNDSKQSVFLNAESQHILILGGSGSGKTQNIIMPTIYWNAQLVNKPNMVISDVKGELTEKFSDFLKKHGYTVYVFDLINPLSDLNNTCLNPLLEIKKDYISYLAKKTGNTLLMTEIENKMNMLIATLLPISSEKDSFWVREARNIVKGLLWLLLEIVEMQMCYFNKKSKTWISDQQFSFSNINTLLTDTKRIKDIVQRIVQLKPQSKAYRFLANSLFVTEATSSGFLAHCQDALAIFYDYGIEYLTSNTTIDFEDFFNRPSVIFIKTSATEKTNYPIAGMIVNSLCHYAQKLVESVPEKKLNNQLLFVLDEFANFPVIQDFDTKISTYRSCNIFFALVLQSLNQLNKYQNQSKTILDNLATKVYIHVELEDAKTISEAIGDKTIVRASYSTSKNNEKGGSSKSESVSNVRLIQPSDITHLPQNHGIVVTAKENPSLVKFTPAYETLIKDIQNKIHKKHQPTFDAENNWIDIDAIEWDLVACLNNRVSEKMYSTNDCVEHNAHEEDESKDENEDSSARENKIKWYLNKYFGDLPEHKIEYLIKQKKILENWINKDLNEIQNEIENADDNNEIEFLSETWNNLITHKIVDQEDFSRNYIRELIIFLDKKIKKINKRRI